MKELSTDLHSQVALFSKETKRLEEAHELLQKRFDELKAKFDASHQTLEKIVSHMSDGLFFVTQEGIVTLYNPAAASIIEIPQEMVLGRPFWDHFCDELFGFPLANALKNGRTPGRILLTLSNEREIEVAPTLIPEKGIVLLLNDRTQLKQLENSVQQSDRLKELGEMAATLAHEIRNPLGGIEGFASLLKRELKEPLQQRMVDSILEGSRTLNSLVINVLEYARPLALHFELTDLAAFIQETAELAQSCGHCCKVKIESRCTASIDPCRMRLVLLNLIRNGCEAGSSFVEIILTKAGKVVIKDRGEGIAEEKLEKIFTPFFTTKTTGTGLGLSEAYKVMQAHGGTITVDSKLGKGTSITLDYGN
ncbi:MAG: ATP-binding protein [Chlamydiales bacterium]|nr:ATP-binding protein [Chlamydiales bacterium]